MKDFLTNILLFFIGISSGAVVAAGLYAFLIIIGVITRLVARTQSAEHISLYEDFIVLGATWGNIVYLFEYSPPFNIIGLVLVGTFSGIFVGCLAAALAEIVETIPVFSKRINLTTGLPIIVVVMALGKSIGSLFQIFINWKSG